MAKTLMKLEKAEQYEDNMACTGIYQKMIMGTLSQFWNTAHTHRTE